MKIFSLLLLLSLNLHAEAFKQGTGSRYKMVSENGTTADLSIYISESSFTKLGVEYFFSTDGIIKSQMWQQFIFKIVDNGPLAIQAGYIKTSEFPKPEALTSEYLNVNNGVQVNDFIFAKKKELDKFKIKQELVEVPAGEIIATHYRKKRNGQVVDFWITDETKPIGLVKLISKNPKNPDHNYQLELLNLLKNVKPTITPKVAVPLTDKGKSILPKPLK